MKERKRFIQQIAMLESTVDELEESKRNSLCSLEVMQVKFENLLEQIALQNTEVEDQKSLVERLRQQINGKSVSFSLRAILTYFDPLKSTTKRPAFLGRNSTNLQTP